jgi:hypothetical protein
VHADGYVALAVSMHCRWINHTQAFLESLYLYIFQVIIFWRKVHMYGGVYYDIVKIKQKLLAGSSYKWLNAFILFFVCQFFFLLRFDRCRKYSYHTATRDKLGENPQHDLLKLLFPITLNNTQRCLCS